MTEFDCEGCGVRVLAHGIDTPPPSMTCTLCDWLGAPDLATIRELHAMGLHDDTSRPVIEWHNTGRPPTRP